ncbi:Vegetative incompatibility protein HET-E-1 [Lachnellula suecica]|uniref:Vegetative incompatibility protein HET-E-1 n=1 Tax=Lachnellula suecica TaxID=602035 RepID=A0A8T9C4E8_9HELO|nr:Vegetative incompatibility protein HET-E-1 [Lachnellula suecica]
MDINNYVSKSIRQRIFNGSLAIRDPNLEELIVQELVKGAKGMFLWVEFQLRDLCEAESDSGIKHVLKNLPRSLGETYDRLLSKIEGAERREIIERLFKWVVCARQPLHVDELREGIAFTLGDREWNPDKVVTNFNRLVRACGNLVVVNSETQVVQLAHASESPFHFTIQEANIMAGEFCIAYLSFSNFETQVIRYTENANTDVAALGKIASRGAIMSPDNPGRGAVRLWNSLRHKEATTNVDLRWSLPKKTKPPDLSKFEFLSYVTMHWLWHTMDFKSKVELT